MLTQIYQNERP